MEQKTVRTPKSVKYPIMKGQIVSFVLEQEQLAQTTVIKIQSCQYIKKDSRLYITIETPRSIYKDIPILVKELPNCSRDQILATGQTILNNNKEPIIISDILQIINKEGVLNIIFKDSEEKIYATPFILG